MTASTGSRSVIRRTKWNFRKNNRQNFVQYRFPSLARIERLTLPLKYFNKTIFAYINRFSGYWSKGTIRHMNNLDEKLGSFLVRGDSENYKIVTQVVRIYLPKELGDTGVQLEEFHIYGCRLGSSATAIDRVSIPENITWQINFQDVEPTTEPVFLLAKRSSVNRLNITFADDSVKRIIEAVIPLNRKNVRTCDMSTHYLSKLVSRILNEPVATFNNFAVKLGKEKNGMSVLNLKFELVTYSKKDADNLKKEAERKLREHGYQILCNNEGKQTTGANKGELNLNY